MAQTDSQASLETFGSSDDWKDDGYDVFADGVVVGRIMKAIAAPEGTPWLWAVAHGFIENRRPTHGHEATPEAAMAAFGYRERGGYCAPTSRDAPAAIPKPAGKQCPAGWANSAHYCTQMGKAK